MALELARALEASGTWAWVADPAAASVVWQAAQPSAFERLAGHEDKPHVFLTMTEVDADELTPADRAGLDAADLIVTPSTWSRAQLLGATSSPVGMIGGGVDPEVFRPPLFPRPRALPFRWLYVGAPNYRKGVDVLVEAWNRHFTAGRAAYDVELYLKTTHEHQAERVEHEANVITDWRRLSTDELVREVYWPAHAFVFPTGGEGWGLTLHEAMATALPAVAAEHAGVFDYARPGTVTFVPGRRVPTETSDNRIVASLWVEPDALAAAMFHVMRNYPAAAACAEAAAVGARSWTWAAAAERCDRMVRSRLRSSGFAQ